MPENESNQPSGEFILYTTEDGQSRVKCRFENETIWLSQALMAELFDTTPQNMTLHLKALYEDEEIDAAAPCKDYLQVRLEGSRQVTRAVKHYNLEAILAVGFRVRSRRGSQFRKWANTRLQEYLVKGFTMDNERERNMGSTAQYKNSSQIPPPARRRTVPRSTPPARRRSVSRNEKWG